jgi:hypothetical protein
MAVAILALSPLRAAAQVTYVPIAPPTDAGADPNPPLQLITVPPPPQVVIVTPAPPAPVVTPAVPAPAVVAPAPVLGATTELHFTSNDDEQIIISVYDNSPDVYDYEAQCKTPCVLLVPNGSYDFMAGDHRTFEVQAIGGTQYWQVEDNSLGGIVAGAVMTGIGGILALAGGVAIAVAKDLSDDTWSWSHHDPDLTAEWTVTGVGIGSAVLGLAIWLFSYGESELVQSAGGYLAAGDGMGILPILLAHRDATGESRWGLGLSLRF